MSHARSTRIPSRLAVVVALVATALAVVSGLSAPAYAQTTQRWVATTGSDTNPGTEAAPYATLQKALDVATPGMTINLKAGKYRQAVITKIDGTAAAPITIKGPETGKNPATRSQAVLYGTGGRVFSIDHSYYTLDGFTIDGQEDIAPSEYQGITSVSQVRAKKDSWQGRADNSKLVYVGAGTKAGITGTTISNMFLTGSGGECVRFRNQTTNGLVVNSLIQWCGMLGLGVEPDQYKYHNAEGVYIGTSPKSTTQPFYLNDTSNNIVVRDSTVNTFGSECFEVKENAHHNRMENVDCGFNDEPLAQQGSNVELRGDHNTVVGSRLSNSRSWNMKLASDSATYDKGGNTAQGTTFSGAATYPIINRQTGSGPFCGNTFPSGGIYDPSGNSVSSPTNCAGSTTPTVTATTPASGATGAPVGDNVTATFSEAVTGVSGTSFTLKTGSTSVGATVTYDGATRKATLDPTADLAAGTQYTAALTSTIKGATGTAIAPMSWTFTTAGTAPPTDTTAPTVTARAPAANATGVAVGGDVTATFSEAVQGYSGTTFTLKSGTSSGNPSVNAVVSYDAATRVLTLNPSANLAANTLYTARLTGGSSAIRDMANNPLANASWTFTTGTPPDTTAPTVTSRNPSNGATGVSRTGNITATFSEAVSNVIAPVGTTPGTFTLRTGTGTVVAAAVRRNGTTNQWILDPNSTLASRTTYTVTLTGGSAGIKDAAGNPLAADVTWTFRTSS
jgi:hypothetical protein